MKTLTINPITRSRLFFLTAVFGTLIWLASTINMHDALAWCFESVIRPAARALKNVFTNPITYTALVAILLVERFMPAKRNQKIFSIGFAQDTVWFFFDIFAQSTIIAALAVFWLAIYRNHFDFLTIRAIEQYPFWLRLTIAIFVADFAGWLHHYMRHKIWWMWPFHAVHHSQRELNLFTAVRYHILEYMLTAIIYVFFFGIFTLNPHTAIYYTIFYNWYTKMTHANIRSNFGILRYILVTPQSHRIHHSYLPEHRDKNMGILFSVWDYIFGTQYRKYDEYPDSGIEDDDFPHEVDAKTFSLFWTMIRQHLYPFEAIGRILAKRRRPAELSAMSVPVRTASRLKTEEPKTSWIQYNEKHEPVTPPVISMMETKANNEP